jgi:plastocyanin
MIRTRLALVAVVAVSALGLTAAAQAASTLTGVVGPGFTITLKQGGAKISALKAGTYTIKISDKSNIHNFHLTGPGVNKKTSVGGTGSSTWKLSLKKGSYKFVCDPHAAIMKGSFKVS